MISVPAPSFSAMHTDINGILLFFDEFDSLALKVQLNPTVRGTLLDDIAGDEKAMLKKEHLKLSAAHFIDSVAGEKLR